MFIHNDMRYILSDYIQALKLFTIQNGENKGS